MKNLECPNCRHPMGFLQFAKAPTPWHLKCKKCHAKLKVGKYAGFVFAAAFSLGAFSAFVSIAFSISLPYYLLALLLIALLVEISLYYLYRKLGIGMKNKNDIVGNAGD